MRDAITIAFIPDIHVPDHDPDAIDLICQYLRTQNIHAIVQAGDLVDHESISRFVRESPAKIAGVRLKEEWELARGVISKLVRAARNRNPDCSYWQLEGNHEARLAGLVDRHPYLEGLLDLPTELGAKANNGTYVYSDSKAEVLRFEWPSLKGTIYSIERTLPTILRGVGFVHGWRFGMHNAKATADLVPWPDPILYGHTHTMQAFTGDGWGLDKPSGYSCGWLGKPFPEYAQRSKANRWQQGFATVELDPKTVGLSNVLLHRITNGRLVIGGKVYETRRGK